MIYVIIENTLGERINGWKVELNDLDSSIDLVLYRRTFILSSCNDFPKHEVLLRLVICTGSWGWIWKRDFTKTIWVLFLCPFNWWKYTALCAAGRIEETLDYRQRLYALKFSRVSRSCMSVFLPILIPFLSSLPVTFCQRISLSVCWRSLIKRCWNGILPKTSSWGNHSLSSGEPSSSMIVILSLDNITKKSLESLIYHVLMWARRSHHPWNR